MNKLQEKRALLALAQRFGQPPAPGLVEEIARLEEEERCITIREAEIRQRIAEDLQQIWGEQHELVQSPPESPPEPTEQPSEPHPQPVQTPIAESIAHKVARVIAESGVVAPEPVLAQPQKDVLQEIKYLREWVSRIAATGPGGGAAQIYNLDIPAKSVTGDYTIGRKDYYIGVSSTVKTYITLPAIGSNVKEGRVVVIKDESGHAQLTPIAIVGNIDNDPNGAEIRINNGAVQLVYHNNGWRII
jgi:hypothetical protein